VEPEATQDVFRGKLISVALESWPAGEREVVRHPGACGVVAFTPMGDVLLVRQTREAIRGQLLEIPAGILDQPGESTAECAARELLEETGYRAERVAPLGAIYSSPGFTDERIELFLVDAVPDREGVEPGVEVVAMPFTAALSAVHDGRIQDGHTVAALLLAREAQERRARPSLSASG
jgi:8-oxo-dGTP pyrophosphatase MutT (NUDIX family)